MSETDNTSTKTNRSIYSVVVAFVLGGVFTAILNYASGWKLQNRSNELEIKRTAQIAAYQSFQDVAFDFEERGRMFVLAQSSQPEVLNLQKDELVRNLTKQVSAADKLRPYVEDQTAIDEYMDAALLVQSEVSSDLPFAEIKPFWSASQELLIQRANIVELINKGGH